MHPRITDSRVAIYARCSSENRHQTSIDDQVRRCREYIATAGGDPNEALIFEDRAISGASLECPGFQLMMNAVDDGQIDVVIAEDLSRISRGFRKLRISHIPLIGIADGINTGAKDAEVS